RAHQPGQRLLVRPVAAEQPFRGRRRSRSSVEQRDVDLAARERLVQHGQIADDQSEEREPDTGFDHDQRAPHSSNRRDVAEAQREERLAAQIEMVGEGAAAADVEGAPGLEQRERRDDQQAHRVVEMRERAAALLRLGGCAATGLSGSALPSGGLYAAVRAFSPGIVTASSSGARLGGDTMSGSSSETSMAPAIT